MIAFQNVTKTYQPSGGMGPTHALREVSFTIKQGEMVFIAGHSGAGKTTLLRMIAALDRPTQGVVQVQNTDVGSLPHSAVPYLRRHLGMVFQEQKLLPDRSVLDNVRLPLLVTGQSTSEASKRARAALDKVGLLARQGVNPATLSGSDQQRVAIARALVNRPAIVLADEPTANLDYDSARRTIEVIRAFVKVGATALIATHDEFLIEHFQARVLRLAQGELIADQPVAGAA